MRKEDSIVQAIRSWPHDVARHAAAVKQRVPTMSDQDVLLAGEGYALQEVPQSIREDVMNIVLAPDPATFMPPSTGVDMRETQQREPANLESLMLTAQDSPHPAQAILDKLEELFPLALKQAQETDISRRNKGRRPLSADMLMKLAGAAISDHIPEAQRRDWFALVYGPEGRPRLDALQARYLPGLH